MVFLLELTVHSLALNQSMLTLSTSSSFAKS
jgi:hypothetical protein